MTENPKIQVLCGSVFPSPLLFTFSPTVLYNLLCLTICLSSPPIPCTDSAALPVSSCRLSLLLSQAIKNPSCVSHNRIYLRAKYCKYDSNTSSTSTNIGKHRPCTRQSRAHTHCIWQSGNGMAGDAAPPHQSNAQIKQSTTQVTEPCAGGYTRVPCDAGLRVARGLGN